MEEKNNIKKDYQVCNCCVMDTTDEDIVFDEDGICNRCNEYKTRILPNWNYGKGHEQELKDLLDEIKKKGRIIMNNKPTTAQRAEI